jgi:probable rRNA maturation factor
MVEVEIVGLRGAGAGTSANDARLPSRKEVRRLARSAAACAQVSEGHLAIEFADERRIAQLNREHRGRDMGTDVLSFPVDGAEPLGKSLPREIGDVVICASLCGDVREAIVHGVLHLVGYDHEADEGEMLALQRSILEEATT